MLAVWPPDGVEVQDWINAYRGYTMLICANHARLDYGEALGGWREIPNSVNVPGAKGGSEMKTFVRGES